MVVGLVVDTCVWFDLAKDHREQPVIDALELLVKDHAIKLVVPEIVLTEFNRNKARVIEEAQRSLRSHFRLVRDAVNRFADDADKEPTLKALKEVDHKIILKGELVNDSMERIEKLLKSSSPMKTTSAIKRAATDRALAQQAPYHRDRNGVGDAILIESYAALLASNKRQSCAFVTHNFKDFSQINGDRRQPHPDLASLFGKRSSYWVSMVDLIKSLDPELLEDIDAEFNFSQEPRRLSEILEAEHLLFRQVWYNRHWNLRSQIESGEVSVVAEKDYSRTPYRQDQILDAVWAQARAAARRTEKEVGQENLGPWTDFEWGMVNGKLSALRWALGDDWDMLDT